MGPGLEFSDGQTPIDEDERDGLLIKSVSTRRELNEFEQLNVQRAMLWTISKKFTSGDILSEGFLNRLHAKMFGDVWEWAGTFRKSNKNMGVDRHQIQQAVRMLLDDCKYWVAHKTHEPDEIALRFKHRLVSIHCYANGNGRHSRLMADIICENIFGRPVFTWGTSIVQSNRARQLYLAAMREADKGNIRALIEFARQ